eukprot:62748-Prymnesium_polylepis.1
MSNVWLAPRADRRCADSASQAGSAQAAGVERPTSLAHQAVENQSRYVAVRSRICGCTRGTR